MKNLNAYMVIRTDTKGGFVVKSDTPDGALRKAMKYSTMAGANHVEVRSFAGGPIVRMTFRVNN